MDRVDSGSALVFSCKLSPDNFFFFFFFLQKIGFDISCKLFPHEIICMKCQSLSVKNIISLSSAEFVQKMCM